MVLEPLTPHYPPEILILYKQVSPPYQSLLKHPNTTKPC